MVNKSIIGATCACLAAGSFNVSAIPIEADWKNAGDSLITYDANTGLDWLDLTVTYGPPSALVNRFLGRQELRHLRFATYFESLTLLETYDDDIYVTGARTTEASFEQLVLVSTPLAFAPFRHRESGLSRPVSILRRDSPPVDIPRSLDLMLITSVLIPCALFIVTGLLYIARAVRRPRRRFLRHAAYRKRRKT